MTQSERYKSAHGQDLDKNMLSPLERGVYRAHYGGPPDMKSNAPRPDSSVPKSQQVAYKGPGFDIYTERRGGRARARGKRRSEM